MDTLLVIIFVFFMKLVTYFLPEILIILLLVVLVGFFLPNKKGDKNKKKISGRHVNIRDNYMRFGQFMEEDDKNQGGGAW